MTLLAPTLQRFFTDRLIHQREASPDTVASYRDSLRLLIGFIAERTGKPPSALDFDDIDDDAITAFLTHLETDRHNTARTRNNRLAAIRALFRYAALRHPEHAEQIARVLAIPQKNHDKAIVTFLTHDETQALLGAPDPGRWEGRRDRAMLALTVQTGIRLAELTGLNCGDLTLGAAAHVTCTGKGRKQRAVPLTANTVAVLRTWTRERGGLDHDPMFPTRTGRRLSPDAIQRRLTLHATTATPNVPIARQEEGDAPRAATHRRDGAPTSRRRRLRHSSLARPRRPAIPQAYLHAHLAIKQRALDATTPTTAKPGRFKPPDPLLAFLEGL